MNKKEIFNGLADWIVDNEPNYPSFAECKLWVKKQNPQYVISKDDEKEILMLLTYLPMSQQMNNVLYAKYLDHILSKFMKRFLLAPLKCLFNLEV